MTISFSGLASGLDTSSWITSLTALKQAKVTTLQTEKQNIISAQETLSGIKSFFSSFRSKIEKITDARFNISNLDIFAKKVAKSSKTSAATASVTSSAQEGSYKVKVDKLATNTQVKSSFRTGSVSTVRAEATTVTKLKDIGIGSGELTIIREDMTGVTLNIDRNSTMQSLVQQLRDNGIEASFDNATSMFSINAGVSDIIDTGHTNFTEKLNLAAAGKGYRTEELKAPETYTEYRVADLGTKLNQLGVTAGQFNIYQEGDPSPYQVTIDDDDTIGSLLSAMQTSGITASFDNGVFSLTNAYIDGSTDTTGIVEAFGLAQPYIDSISGTSDSLRANATGDILSNENTTFAELGINQTIVSYWGDYTRLYEIYDHNDVLGMLAAVTVNGSTTLGDFVADLNSKGISASFMTDGTGIMIDAEHRAFYAGSGAIAEDFDLLFAELSLSDGGFMISAEVSAPSTVLTSNGPVIISTMWPDGTGPVTTAIETTASNLLIYETVVHSGTNSYEGIDLTGAAVNYNVTTTVTTTQTIDTTTTTGLNMTGSAGITFDSVTTSTTTVVTDTTNTVGINAMSSAEITYETVITSTHTDITPTTSTVGNDVTGYGAVTYDSVWTSTSTAVNELTSTVGIDVTSSQSITYETVTTSTNTVVNPTTSTIGSDVTGSVSVTTTTVISGVTTTLVDTTQTVGMNMTGSQITYDSVVMVPTTTVTEGTSTTGAAFSSSSQIVYNAVTTSTYTQTVNTTTTTGIAMTSSSPITYQSVTTTTTTSTIYTGTSVAGDSPVLLAVQDTTFSGDVAFGGVLSSLSDLDIQDTQYITLSVGGTQTVMTFSTSATVEDVVCALNTAAGYDCCSVDEIDNLGFIHPVIHRDTSGMIRMTTVASGATLSSGTYSISTTDDLMKLSTMVASGNIGANCEFVLANDIDMNGVTGYTGIGNTSRSFTAAFDGNGYVISNLSITQDPAASGNSGGQGLFGSMSEHAEVKNLGIENVYISVNQGRTGAIVGKITNYAKIANCYVSGGTIKSNNAFAGGIAGEVCAASVCIAISWTNLDSVSGNSSGNTDYFAKASTGYSAINNYCVGHSGNGATQVSSESEIPYNGGFRLRFNEGLQCPGHGANISECDEFSKIDEKDYIDEKQLSISTADDLVKLATMVNNGHVGSSCEFILTNDIDLSSVCGEGIGNWTPIGTEDYNFMAMFNGNGYTISGLYLNDSGENKVGLFGSVDGIIENLSVTNAYVNGQNCVGILAGFLSFSGQIGNCYVSGDVNGVDSAVGGFVGNNEGAIQNSTSAAVVHVLHDVAGGITGCNNGTVTNCIATGDIDFLGNNTPFNIGFITGDGDGSGNYYSNEVQNATTINTSGTPISFCITGMTNILQKALGLYGYIEEGTSYHAANLNTTLAALGVSGNSTIQVRDVQTNEILTHTFQSSTTIDQIGYSLQDNGFHIAFHADHTFSIDAGNGNYVIESISPNLANALNVSSGAAYSTQTQTSTTTSTSTVTATGSTQLTQIASGTLRITILNTGTGGTQVKTFNGNSTINDVIGQLDRVGITATLNDGVLSIGASSSGKVIKGISPGLADGLHITTGGNGVSYQVVNGGETVTLTTSTTTPTVATGSTKLGSIGVSTTQRISILNTATGETDTLLYNVSDTINGIVNALHHKGFNPTITDGVLSVDAGDGSYVITGIDSQLANALHISSPTYNTSPTMVTIVNPSTESTIQIAADSATTLGQLGLGPQNMVRGGTFIGGVVPRSTANMTALSSIDSHNVITSGTYSISTAEELAQLADMVGNGNVGSDCEFVLANNIDLSSLGGGNTNWHPIGEPSSSDSAFTAKFDGNGYVISNLFCDRSDDSFVGLFGTVDGGTITNLGIEGADVSGNAKVGILAGHVFGSSISNCYVMGDVSGYGMVGGLVGRSDDSSIYDSYSKANAIGDDALGGLVGYTDMGVVSGCYSIGEVGNVVEDSGDAGRLIGAVHHDTTITNSYTSANVSYNNSPNSIGTYVESEDLIPILATNTVMVENTPPVQLELSRFIDPVTTHRDTSTMIAMGTVDISATLDEGTYAISTADDLYKLQTMQNSGNIRPDCEFVLANNIDMSSTLSTGWDGIGNYTHAFAATFDGNGYEISGLCVLGSGVSKVGLFGHVTQGTITNLGVTNAYLGGIDHQSGILAGLVEGGTISNCYTSGSVYGDQEVGGLVGEALSADINNSYSTADVRVENGGGGGLAGVIYQVTITNCYTTGYVLDESSSGAAGNLFGYDGGESTVINCFTLRDDYNQDYNVKSIYEIPMLTQEMQFVSTRGFTKPVTERDTSTMIAMSTVDNHYTLSPGTYSISTTADLAKLAEMTNEGKIGSDCEFVLAEDIDLSSFGSWTPIGRGDGSPFEATFDGNGHTISGLYIEDQVLSYGLFGVNAGTITNLAVTEAYVYNKYNACNGILASYNAGEISNCYTSGSVYGNGDVGGLVGVNEGEIYDSYSSANITGTAGVGGFVGNAYTGSMTNCYSTGNVKCLSDDTCCGALAGNEEGAVFSNCYSSGNVSYYNSALVTAGVQATSPSSIPLTNVNYTINNTDFIGGVTHRDTSGMIDFSTVSGSATLSSGTYAISTAANLEKLADMTNDGKIGSNCEFVLANDINLSSVCGDSIGNWEAIGDANNGFNASFDGNGYKVRGLYIDDDTRDECAGLFGYVDRGSISNLGVEDAYVSANNANTSVTGILAGYATYSNITNCYTSGSVNGGEYVGGLVGHIKNHSNVSDSYSTADVSSVNDYFGGFAGYIAESTCTNCYSTGDVTYTGEDSVFHAGAFVGSIENDPVITECYTSGSVSGCDATNCYGVSVSSVEQIPFYARGSQDIDNSFTIQLRDTSQSLFLEDNSQQFSTDGMVAMGTVDATATLTSGSYAISTTSDLQKLAAMTNSGKIGSGCEFYLANNIDLSSVCGEGIGNWTAIGNQTNKFSAYFEGNGYEISGLYIDKTSTNDADGLFGFVNNGAIRYLAVTNAYVDSSKGAAGIIVGAINHGTIRNCYSSGELRTLGAGGGLAGAVDDSNILSCHSDVNVTGDYYLGDITIGGLAGMSNGYTDFNNCYSTGTITDLSSGAYGLGELVGIPGGANFFNCYSSGSVVGTATNNIGTHVSDPREIPFYTHPYITETFSSESTIGDVLDFLDDNGITASISNGVISITRYHEKYINNIDGDLADALNLNAGAGVSYQYTTETRTITTGTTETQTVAATGSTYLRDLTPNPITSNQNIVLKRADGTGSDMTISFNGNNTIDAVLSFFNNFGFDATIDSGGVVHIDQDAGTYYISSMDSALANALNISFGEGVSYQTINGTTQVVETTTTTQTRSATTSTKLGTLGVTETQYIILANTATGANQMLVYTANSTIQNVIEGLNGKGFDASLDSQSKLHINTDTGEYVITGINEQLSAALHITVGEGVSWQEAQAGETIITTTTHTTTQTADGNTTLSQLGVTDHNFINPVTRRDTSTMIAMGTVDSSATLSSGTYAISTAEDLAKLATMTNNDLIGSDCEFVLANDIDLSSYNNWTPIGYSSSHDFTATFDGNGYEISNLSVSGVNFGGLFGVVDSGTVSNLGIVNSDISAVNASSAAGAIAGAVSGGIIDNCYVSNWCVNSGTYSGALVGYANSRAVIENSWSSNPESGNVTSVGGLIGHGASTVAIIHCGVSGDIQAAGTVVYNAYVTGNPVLTSVVSSTTNNGQSTQVDDMFYYMGLGESVELTNIATGETETHNFVGGSKVSDILGFLNSKGFTASIGNDGLIDIDSSDTYIISGVSTNLQNALKIETGSGESYTIIHDSNTVITTTTTTEQRTATGSTRLSTLGVSSTQSITFVNTATGETSTLSYNGSNTINHVINGLNGRGFSAWISDGIVNVNTNTGAYVITGMTEQLSEALNFAVGEGVTYQNVLGHETTLTTTTETVNATATGNTLLGSLGITTTQYITIKNTETGATTRLSYGRNNTINNIISGLDGRGFSASIDDNGVMHIDTDSDAYVITGVSPDLANALHLTTGEGVSYQTNVQHNEQTSSSQLVSQTAMTGSTSLGALGIYSNQYLTLINTSTGSTNVTSYNGSNTVNDVVSYLNTRGFSASVSDGTVTINGNTGEYIVSGMSPDLASALGLNGSFGEGLSYNAEYDIMVTQTVAATSTDMLADFGFSGRGTITFADGYQITVRSSDTFGNLVAQLGDAGMEAEIIAETGQLHILGTDGGSANAIVDISQNLADFLGISSQVYDYEGDTYSVSSAGAVYTTLTADTTLGELGLTFTNGNFVVKHGGAHSTDITLTSDATVSQLVAASDGKIWLTQSEPDGPVTVNVASDWAYHFAPENAELFNALGIDIKADLFNSKISDIFTGESKFGTGIDIDGNRVILGDIGNMTLGEFASALKPYGVDIDYVNGKLVTTNNEYLVDWDGRIIRCLADDEGKEYTNRMNTTRTGDVNGSISGSTKLVDLLDTTGTSVGLSGTSDTIYIASPEIVTNGHNADGYGVLGVSQQSDVLMTPDLTFINPVNHRDTSTMRDMASVGVNELISYGTYSISTTSDLQKLATMTNSGIVGHDCEFVLANNIDLSSVCGEGIGNWTPIGNNYKFGATFDGNGYEISGLYINDEGMDAGLFGELDGATISNLGIVNADITAHSKAGILAGEVSNSAIRNCYTSGALSVVTHAAGGLVGEAYRTNITNSYSTADVYNSDEAGGFAGIATECNISSCYSTGTVIDPSGDGGPSLGAFVGNNNGYNTVTNSYTSGKVITNSSTPQTVCGTQVVSPAQIPFFASGELVGVSGSDKIISSLAAAGKLDIVRPEYLIQTMSGSINVNESTTFAGLASDLASLGVNIEFDELSHTYKIGNPELFNDEKYVAAGTSAILTMDPSLSAALGLEIGEGKSYVLPNGVVRTAVTSNVGVDTKELCQTGFLAINGNVLNDLGIPLRTYLEENNYWHPGIGDNEAERAGVFTYTYIDAHGDEITHTITADVTLADMLHDMWIGFDANSNTWESQAPITGMSDILANAIGLSVGEGLTYCSPNGTTLMNGTTTASLSTTLGELGYAKCQIGTNMGYIYLDSESNTLGDLVNGFGSIGVTATLSNGKLTLTPGEGVVIEDSKLVPKYDPDDRIVNNLFGIEIGNGLTYTETSGQNIGITTGTFEIIDHGNTILATVTSNTTINNLRSILASHGITVRIDGTQLTLSASDNCYLSSEHEGEAGMSNVVSKLFSNVTRTSHSTTGELGYDHAYTSMTADATTDTLLSAYDSDGSLCEGLFAFSINGQDKYINVTADETIGTFIEKLNSKGLEASFDNENHILSVSSGGDDFIIDSVNSTSKVFDNLGFDYYEDFDNYLRSSEAVMADKEVSTLQNLSVANYADLTTSLSTVGISAGSVSVYRDGVKKVIQLGADETFDSFNTKLTNAFAEGDVRCRLEEGRLQFYSTTEGVKILAGSSSDTSNILSVCGLYEGAEGITDSTRQLYKVNSSSLVTASGVFRRGDVSTGTFTIGDATFTVNSDTTIAGLISQINSSEKSGATAYWDSIDGKLVVTARTSGASIMNIETGSSNFTDIMGFTITERSADDSIVTTRIDRELQTLGSNAKFSINGTEFTSSSNTVTSDISRIKGLTINLKNVSSEAFDIYVEKDTDAITEAVQEFVDSYNELIENIDTELENANEEFTDKFSLKQIRNQIRSIALGTFSNAGLYSNLTSIGITTQQSSGANISTTGLSSLYLDAGKFYEKFAQSPDSIKLLLVGDESSSGILSQIESVVENALTAGSGYFSSAEKSYQRKIENINEKISKANKAVEAYRARLESKFQSMDLIISKMQEQYNSFLSGGYTLQNNSSAGTGLYF